MATSKKHHIPGPDVAILGTLNVSGIRRYEFLFLFLSLREIDIQSFAIDYMLCAMYNDVFLRCLFSYNKMKKMHDKRSIRLTLLCILFRQQYVQSTTISNKFISYAIIELIASKNSQFIEHKNNIILTY